jgi:hypothetical protein
MPLTAVLCVAAKSGARLPLWVRNGHQVTSAQCPLYPSKRTPVQQGLMSALGLKQTLGKVRLMSAIPPKADIAERRCHVRFVPKADSCTAATDLQGLAYSITSSARVRTAEGIARGSLQIDNVFVLDRRLHRQVRWLLAPLSRYERTA